MLVKADWMWNSMNQNLYDRAETIVKINACMQFYDTSIPLDQEADASVVGLGVG